MYHAQKGNLEKVFFCNKFFCYEELQKLQINVQDRMGILNRAGERFEFENMQKQVKKKKEEIDEEERSS